MNDRHLAHGHAARNAELVRKLRERGVDLQTLRSIEHHFWSKTQRDAALLRRSFTVVDFCFWCLLPPRHVKALSTRGTSRPLFRDTIQHAASDDVARDLVALAASFNSRYDGWGTSV